MRTSYAIVLALLFCAADASARQSISVVDVDGKLLSNIIIELQGVNVSPSKESQEELRSQTSSIEQRDQQFVPHISIIRAGTELVFPNTDTVGHHVYSFSPAKTFEVTLEQQVTSKPILFDTAGIVELGCNIHDWMLAYVYVSDADFFAQTDESGRAVFELESGTYNVSLWHPRLTQTDMAKTTSVIIESGEQELTIRLSEPLLESLSGYDSVEAVDGY